MIIHSKWQRVYLLLYLIQNIDRKKSMIIETNAAFKTFIKNIVFCVEQILYSDCTLMLML